MAQRVRKNWNTEKNAWVQSDKNAQMEIFDVWPGEKMLQNLIVEQAEFLPLKI